MAKLWVGVDIGKAHHHVAAVDGEGRLVNSRKVDNDEGQRCATRVLTLQPAAVGAILRVRDDTAEQRRWPDAGRLLTRGA